MKKKYSKPTLETEIFGCSEFILTGSPIDVAPNGEKDGDWNAGAKNVFEDAESNGW